MGPLRIGINALYLIPGEVGGTEIYLRSLLAAIAAVDAVNRYVIFINSESASDPPVAESPRFQLVRCGVRARFRPARIVWEQSLFPLLLRRHGIDVLLNPGFTSPLFWPGPSVTVFHDLQHRRHPEFFRWFDLPFWNLLLRLSIMRSRALIAVSKTTAADLARYYPEAAAKTVVIPHGVDPEFFRIGERRGTAVGPARPRYLLSVSTLHTHKNVKRLLEAFRLFRSAHGEYRLVVAGMKGFAAERLESIRSRPDLKDSVTFTGWIPRPDLYRLFEFADAFIAPSLFEGFGMPIVEALAAGIPSACSDIEVFRECAGPAALRFDPYSVSGIAAAMEVVAFDANFRSRAAKAGPEQAAQADWKVAAALTLKCLRKAFIDGCSRSPSSTPQKT